MDQVDRPPVCMDPPLGCRQAGYQARQEKYSYNESMSADHAAIILYGTTWCGDTRRARKLFDQYDIPYQWVDIDTDPAAAAYVKKKNRGFRSVPTIIWPDGSILVEPSNEQLLQKMRSHLSGMPA